jgi:hypothetical protein
VVGRPRTFDAADVFKPGAARGELDEAGLRRNMRYYTGALAIDGIFSGLRYFYEWR